MKYVVVKCTPLNDQWECDADREPLWLTDDISKFGGGYEVYEVQSNGFLKKIKDYDECLDEGFCICWWGEDEDKPLKIEKLPYKNREDMTKTVIKKLKTAYNLTGTIKEIFSQIQCVGHYSELIENETKVFSIGEYFDDDLPRGW